MVAPSHAPIAVAVAMALSAGRWAVAASFCAVLAGSLLYHRSRETRFVWADCGAGGLALWVFALVAIDMARRGRAQHAALCLAVGAAALTVFGACGDVGDPSYEVLHPLWHVLAGAGGVLLFVGKE